MTSKAYRGVPGDVCKSSKAFRGRPSHVCKGSKEFRGLPDDVCNGSKAFRGLPSHVCKGSKAFRACSVRVSLRLHIYLFILYLFNHYLLAVHDIDTAVRLAEAAACEVVVALSEGWFIAENAVNWCCQCHNTSKPAPRIGGSIFIDGRSRHVQCCIIYG